MNAENFPSANIDPGDQSDQSGSTEDINMSKNTTCQGLGEGGVRQALATAQKTTDRGSQVCGSLYSDIALGVTNTTHRMRVGAGFANFSDTF